MGAIQYHFKRVEEKYFLTRRQYAYLLPRLAGLFAADEYGKTAICNIYYDTVDWRLIRASVQKPVYKEKLRVRSYGVPGENGTVFAELKKKYDGVVYKRRIKTDAAHVGVLLESGAPAPGASQVEREILWFQHFYQTEPKVFIGYDRTAYFGRADAELRVTFDENLRYRQENLDLRAGDGGYPLLDDDLVLMELKLPGACPLPLCHLLSEVGAYPVSFSKYGQFYTDYILKQKPKNSVLQKEALPGA